MDRAAQLVLLALLLLVHGVQAQGKSSHSYSIGAGQELVVRIVIEPMIYYDVLCYVFPINADKIDNFCNFSLLLPHTHPCMH